MDTDAVLRLLVDVAEEVINPRFRSLDEDQVAEKNPGDLVTVADREAEVRITRELLAAYPDAVVLGEEAYAGRPELMDAFRSADHAFTVDPVDGTKNFVHGSPDHAVMVAELRTGTPVRSWIWQPQHGLAYVAEQGAGAYRNGERLTRRPPAGDPQTWSARTSHRRWLGRTYGDLGPLELTWVSCGIDYPHLVEGDADLLLYSRAHPWDHAPGQLLLAEAGGRLGTVDGADYLPGSPEAPRGLLAAASSTVYEQAQRLLA